MDVAAAITRMPLGNLGRLPRPEFERVWTHAEHIGTQHRVTPDWYLTGVLATLRWVAHQPLKTPVTDVISAAMPETMDTEYVAAIRAAHDTRLHPMRTGIAAGTAAVLGWLGYGGPEPLTGQQSTSA